MRALFASPLIRSIVANPVVWSLAILAVLAAGLSTASTALLIVSGALAVARPVLRAALVAREAEEAAPRRRLAFERRTAARGVS